MNGARKRVESRAGGQDQRELTPSQQGRRDVDGGPGPTPKPPATRFTASLSTTGHVTKVSADGVGTPRDCGDTSSPIFWTGAGTPSLTLLRTMEEGVREVRG
jgi:hypothetical protein